MSGDVGRFGPDPRCICPETTFSGGPTAADRAKCRERSPWLHRIIGIDELKQLRVALERGEIE